MNTVGHQGPGLWRHPRDRSREYRDLDNWVGLARQLEASLVDGIFIADVMGVYGRLRFDPKNHQVIPAKDPKEGAVGSILQWQDGKRVVVYPESIAAGEIQLPPWMKP